MGVISFICQSKTITNYYFQVIYKWFFIWWKLHSVVMLSFDWFFTRLLIYQAHVFSLICDLFFLNTLEKNPTSQDFWLLFYILTPYNGKRYQKSVISVKVAILQYVLLLQQQTTYSGWNRNACGAFIKNLITTLIQLLKKVQKFSVNGIKRRNELKGSWRVDCTGCVLAPITFHTLLPVLKITKSEGYLFQEQVMCVWKKYVIQHFNEHHNANKDHCCRWLQMLVPKVFLLLLFTIFFLLSA